MASITTLAIMLATIIARDYFFGERWRSMIDGETVDAPNSPRLAELLIIILGVIGIITFIVGFIGLAYTATGLIGIG